jgi:hypothetical protein
MGCCSLLAIERVLSVDPQSRTDLDYRASPDQPDIGKVGCGYRLLMPLERSANLISAQREAERGQQTGSSPTLSESLRSGLAKLLSMDSGAITGIRQTRKSQGRVVYEWKRRGRAETYMIVMSRPHLLSFHAKNSTKVAWAIIAAYESSCQ